MTSPAQVTAAARRRVQLAGLDWDGPPPAAGDLVILEVTRPLPSARADITGPAGWTRCEHGGELLQAWWTVIGPRDPDPVFTAPGPVRRWEVRAASVAGAQLVRAEGLRHWRRPRRR